MKEKKITIDLTKEEARSLFMAICNRMDVLKGLKEGAESVIPDEEFARECEGELQLLEPLYRRVFRASI